MNVQGNRLLELLILVGYSIEFPAKLAQRIGGHEQWNRHVMYRAIRERYVFMNRMENPRHVIKSLQLTEKGFEYIAERAPEALAMICGRIDKVPTVYPSMTGKIRRLHAIATGMVMARGAGALVFPRDKPSLMYSEGGYGRIPVDPEAIYYYSPFEIRAALEEKDKRTVSKGVRLIGIIIRGHRCYCMYFTGASRMFWQKLMEENHVSGVMSLLKARGFNVSVTRQIIIGNNMNVAEKLCHSSKPFGGRYFTVSKFFDRCCYVTNNAEGDEIVRLLLNTDLANDFNRQVLSDYLPPRVNTREYDAIDPNGNRPVLLNYWCDLIPLTIEDPSPTGFPEEPVMLCFDYQTQVIQRILGPSIEVRPIVRK